MMNRVIVAIFCLFLAGQVAVAAPKKTGTFYFNLGQGPTTLNPLSSTDYYASQVQGQILEGLLDRDINTYEWQPALAEKWEIAKDGKSYFFTIRDGVKWHDGKPLTVEDVKFSFDAIVHPENKYKTAHMKPYYENIASAEIVDKKTVKFTVKKVYFRNFDVVAGLTIVPRHLYENPSKKQLKKLNKTLIGTGAYMLDKYKRGKSLSLKANPNWWGLKDADQAKKNNFKKVLMRFIKDPTIAITRAEKGDLDFISLTSEDYVKKTGGAKWGKEINKFKVQNKAPRGYGYIGWNLTSPKFKSVKTRKALYHLINRELMIEKFRFGYSLPATGPLYQQSEYANKKVKPVEFNPKKALKLLREDGWKVDPKDNILVKTIDGKKVKFTFTILEPRQDFMKYLTIFKEDAKKAGVDISLKYVEWNTFIKLLDEGKFDAVRLGWSAGSPEWDPKQIWHSSSMKGGSNYISYSNPKVDKLIDQARVTVDKKKRTAMLKKVYKMIADDAPYAFLFNDKYTFYANRKRIQKEKDTYNYGIGTDHWWVTK
ncbi:MAG: ABC transporter substrate-binding protein [Bacteriovoracaceae bacterium]